jgi:hypothetical protein
MKMVIFYFILDKLSIYSQTNINNLLSIDLNDFSSIFKVEPQEILNNSKIVSPLQTFEALKINQDFAVNKYHVYNDLINLIFHDGTLLSNTHTDDEFLIHIEKLINTYLATNLEDPKSIYIKLLIFLTGVNILNHEHFPFFSVNDKENFLKLQIFIIDKLKELINQIKSD